MQSFHDLMAHLASMVKTELKKGQVIQKDLSLVLEPPTPLMRKAFKLLGVSFQ